MQDIRSKTMTLFRLAKTIRGDLYSVDEDLSETIIYKRMSIEHHIADLNEFKESIKEIVNKFIGLSEKWHELLQENFKFHTFLKCHADEDELDRQFLRLHEELFADYDCCKCRNCCKMYKGSIPVEDIDGDE